MAKKRRDARTKRCEDRWVPDPLAPKMPFEPHPELVIHLERRTKYTEDERWHDQE